MLSLPSALLFLSSGASAFLLDDHYQKAPVRRAVVTRTTFIAGPEPTSTAPASSSCGATFWLEQVAHQGIASFNNDTQYQVFRNVKDYGAVGDGKSDDTKAIQKAITDGNRCAPTVCKSSTRTPATVYFPAGTYLISEAIIDYYYTQLIGNPNCLPTIKASSNFSTVKVEGLDIGYLIDASPYGADGKLGYGATNTFFRQIRNLVLDSTSISPNTVARGIHWPTAQTTSLQNIFFNMTAGNGTRHEGIFIEEGSGGFMADLVFEGGNFGMNVGNQQFTARNLTFRNVDTAINQVWDWGWTYKSISIDNCRVGLNISSTKPNGNLNVGSITLFDSLITNTLIGIVTSRTESSQPDGAGNMYIENVELHNVQHLIVGGNGTILAGSSGSLHIDAWADGHRYLPVYPVNPDVRTPFPPLDSRGPIAPSKRPSKLLDADGKYYERSKPQYQNLTATEFLSARNLGAKGDGQTDDTIALNEAIKLANASNKVLFVDAGYYKVSSTIYVPAGSRIVGEALSSVILANGPFFADINHPKPVVQVGKQGEHGVIEWSDFFISTQGPLPGAILIEYNLYSEDEPAGLWDVHTRIGGFAGSHLQREQCVKTPDTLVTLPSVRNGSCIAAYLSLHITPWASGAYFENNWLWVADHDLDDSLNNNTQISVYAGRGLLDQSVQGRVWLYGTAVEHHVMYEYQFVDTKDVFMGQIQTETAYFQPNPPAPIPFLANPALYDPTFPSSPPPTNSTAHPVSPNNADGWGLRILRSNNLHVYGAGLYSFFDNYSTECSDIESQGVCQTRIFSIEGDALSHDINVYNLNTVGTTWMVTRDGLDLVASVDNNGTFVDGVNVFRIAER